MDIIKQLDELGTYTVPEQNEIRWKAMSEIERLREALRNVLTVQPIKGDEGSADIVSLAKALLEIDTIARAALKEKE